MTEARELDRLQDMLGCSFEDARLYRRALREAPTSLHPLRHRPLLAPLVVTQGEESEMLLQALRRGHPGCITFLRSSSAREVEAEYSLRRRLLTAGYAKQLKHAVYTMSPEVLLSEESPLTEEELASVGLTVHLEG